jgi:hypothetical protein
MPPTAGQREDRLAANFREQPFSEIRIQDLARPSASSLLSSACRGIGSLWDTIARRVLTATCGPAARRGTECTDTIRSWKVRQAES